MSNLPRPEEKTSMSCQGANQRATEGTRTNRTNKVLQVSQVLNIRIFSLKMNDDFVIAVIKLCVGNVMKIMIFVHVVIKKVPQCGNLFICQI
jgi:hypothetical protein